ncbi:MAG: dihydrofolate reductase [Cyclobacteriaceae bacterium]|nr:dihydrofolate reductase [Cyclobacteriaceae bacterium]
MRKVILGVAVSLDNFIEGPNGEYDWCFMDQDYGLTAFMSRIDSIFMGRKSFELASTTGDQNPWKGIHTYVFSNTLKCAPDGTTLLQGDVLERVREIKKEDGKDIWLFGGASLTSSLMNAGLVDELWLAVHPILLGQGKPLFSDIQQRIKTRLLETKTYTTGLVSLRYGVARE